MCQTIEHVQAVGYVRKIVFFIEIGPRTECVEDGDRRQRRGRRDGVYPMQLLECAIDRNLKVRFGRPCGWGVCIRMDWFGLVSCAARALQYTRITRFAGAILAIYDG